MDEVLRRARVPLAVSALLVALSLAVRVAAYRLQVADPASEPVAALRWFDVNSERNVPTTWSVLLLLAASLLAAGLALREHRWASAWTMTSLVTALLALDEGLALHERLGVLGSAVAGDLLHFAWVVPGALVAAATGVVLLAAFRRQPRQVRRRLVAAGAVYLTGALVLETLSGVVLRADGDREAYVLVTALEEGLEMGGACLLLGALLLARATAATAATSRQTVVETAVVGS